MARPKNRGHKTKPAKRRMRNILPLQAPNNGRIESLDQGTITKQEADIRRQKGRGDSSELLTSDDPKELLKDIQQIDKALRNRWGVRRKDMIRQRMEEIVAKTNAQVVTKEGLEDSATKADELAIAATQALIKMDALDQKDEHFEVKSKKPELPQLPGMNVYGDVNIGNNQQNNVAEDRRAKILELAERFGASRVVIEDRTDGTEIKEDAGKLVEDHGPVGSLPKDDQQTESGFGSFADLAPSKTS